MPFLKLNGDMTNVGVGVNPEAFFDFLKDEALVELIELGKTTDDLFDVVKLGENQHSQMLAWLLSPNEGHLQGDAIVKDFLVAAYHASSNCTHENKKFFSKWTPGRIRTSGFGSIFVETEFVISSGRLDILLVDILNKILVVVENKFGSKLGEKQLEKYIESVKDTLPLNGYFKGFDLAFVYLDVNLDEMDDGKRGGLSKRWSHLSYSWLEASAKRAKFQLSGNRNAAQLLISYVQKQTSWMGPSLEKINELSADLALRHPGVVALFGQILLKNKDMWDGRFLSSDVMRDAANFFAQNRDICIGICEMAGLAAIEHKIIRQNEFVADYSSLGRKKLWMSCPSTQRFMTDDAWGPQIAVFEVVNGYDLYLWWPSKLFIKVEEEALLKDKVAAKISQLKKRRWIKLGSKLSRESVIEAAGSYLTVIDQIFSAHGEENK